MITHRLFLATIGVALHLAGPARAEVADDMKPRLREYADRAIDFSPEGSASYTLKRGGKAISDLDLATSSGDPSLVATVRLAMLKGRLYRTEIGLLAFPIGMLVGADNFFGYRPNSQKNEKLGNLELPPSLVAPFPADDLRSFVAASLGVAVALYGAWQLGELVGEAIGSFRPQYLAVDEVKEATLAYNKRLEAELNLPSAGSIQLTVAASPSPTPAPLPETFPLGVEGSAAWAIRKAVAAIQAVEGGDYRAFSAWTTDLRDFESGVVGQGSWHVSMSTTDARPDLDVSVPRFGGATTWLYSSPEWTPYRGGRDLVDKVLIDSPKALELLKPEFVSSQIGWFKKDDRVVLFPFYYRLKEPLWLVQLGNLSLAPWVGAHAATGHLVNLMRYRL